MSDPLHIVFSKYVFGALAVLTVVSVLLRLAGAITWPWLWVLAPFWTLLVLFIALVMVVGIIMVASEGE